MTKRLALVTWGSRGPGKNAVLKLADKGIDSIFTFRNGEQEADEVVKAVECHNAKAVALKLDVADSGTFAPFTRQVAHQRREVWQRERFDWLIGLDMPIREAFGEAFDALFAVHLKGPFFLTQALLPLLEDGGPILNVSSGLTRFALPGKAVYAAMKGAVEVLTRYLAKELGERRISANRIAPGAIATDFSGGDCAE